MTNLMNIKLWADQDGVAPTQTVTDHPSLLEINPLLTISQFASTTARARVKQTYEAPVYASDQEPVSALHALEALQQIQATQQSHPYYSFGIWTGQHDKSGHKGQTAVTLEYDVKNSTKVMSYLANDCQTAFYVIPTVAKDSNCYLFAIPLEKPTTWTETIRLASLIASVVDQQGLTADSQNPTYLFKLRSDNSAYFIDGDILNPTTALANARGIATSIAKYQRK